MQKKTKIGVMGAGVVGAGLLLAAGVAAVAVAAKGEHRGWRGQTGADMGTMGAMGAGHMRGHRAGYRQRFGGPTTQADFDERTRSRFAKFDSNSDGVIDEAEVRARFQSRREKRRNSWSRRRGRGDMGRRWKNKLARRDTNGDGMVSRDEHAAHVKQMFARMDLNNDGRITDEDLPPRLRGRDFLKSGTMGGRWMGRGGRGERFGRGKMMRKAMRLRAADADKDGVITLDEVMAAAAGKFSRRDRNGDGSIDDADREARMKANLEYRVKRFIHRFGPDADQTGKVTREQFDKKARERFARLDVNKDGSITRDERRGARGWRHGRRGGGWRGHGFRDRGGPRGSSVR